MTVLSAIASFLLPVALLFLQPWISQLPAKISASEDDRCNARSLPPDIQNYLASNFGSWKIQRPQDLSEFARKTWTGRKAQSCPGIAVGKFQSMKSASYAVLLVAANRPDSGYRFVIFNPTPVQSFEATIVETYDESGGSNYFIQKASVSDWFSAASKKKFQVQTQEAIVMVDSAEQEYGAEIYFWSNGNFRHEPIDN